MITKADIISFAHHVTRRGNGIPDRKIMHPYRAWYVGVGAACVLVCAGAAYNYYLFRYYNAVEEHVTESEVRVVEYRYDLDERVRTRFEARVAAFKALYGGRDMHAVAPVEAAADESAAVQLAP